MSRDRYKSHKNRFLEGKPFYFFKKIFTIINPIFIPETHSVIEKYRRRKEEWKESR